MTETVTKSCAIRGFSITTSNLSVIGVIRFYPSTSTPLPDYYNNI